MSDHKPTIRTTASGAAPAPAATSSATRRAPIDRATSGWRPGQVSRSQPTFWDTTSRGGTSRGGTAWSLTGLTGATAVAGRRAPLARARSPWIGAGLALTVLGLAVLGLVWARQPIDERATGGDPVAILALARGGVRLSSPEWGDAPRGLTMASNTSLRAGMVLDTRRAGGAASRGTAGRAAFQLASGATVRVDGESRVRLVSSTALVLERGAVYVDAARGASVEVRTSLGVVRDIGTQFEVRLVPDGRGTSDTMPTDAGADRGAGMTEGRGSIQVRVREGAVMVARDGGEERADAGEALSLHRDGTLTRRAISRHGPAWAWVLETAVVPPLEGRTLAWFLEWKAREGGWTLRYDDSQTARLADHTILHGNATGLDPVAAARMVFEGSGLRYRIDEGDLHVSPATRE